MYTIEGASSSACFCEILNASLHTDLVVYSCYLSTQQQTVKEPPARTPQRGPVSKINNYIAAASTVTGTSSKVSATQDVQAGDHLSPGV